MKLGPNSKPHRNEHGYVCEMRCKSGGHVVIYDLDIRLPENREAGAKRWRVQHEPSSNGAGMRSLKDARANMKLLARAKEVADAGVLWYILPAFRTDAQAALADHAEPVKTAPRQAAYASEAERLQLLDTFMADPENEPSPAGMEAHRRLFK